MPNRAARRQIARAESKSKEIKKYSTPKEPTRAKRRSLLNMLKKSGKVIKPYKVISKKMFALLKDTIGLGSNKTYGYPTCKSTGRKPFGA